MSRTQDLVLARLRLIALRWQGGMPDVGEVTGSDPAGSDPSDSDLPTWPGPASWIRLVGILIVIVAIGGAAVLVTSWPRERPAVASAPSAGPSGDPFDDPFPAASPSPAPSVMVHVVGEVRDPGVVELPEVASSAGPTWPGCSPTGSGSRWAVRRPPWPGEWPDRPGAQAGCST